MNTEPTVDYLRFLLGKLIENNKISSILVVPCKSLETFIEPLQLFMNSSILLQKLKRQQQENTRSLQQAAKMPSPNNTQTLTRLKTKQVQIANKKKYFQQSKPPQESKQLANFLFKLFSLLIDLKYGSLLTRIKQNQQMVCTNQFLRTNRCLPSCRMQVVQQKKWFSTSKTPVCRFDQSKAVPLSTVWGLSPITKPEFTPSSLFTECLTTFINIIYQKSDSLLQEPDPSLPPNKLLKTLYQTLFQKRSSLLHLSTPKQDPEILMQDLFEFYLLAFSYYESISSTRGPNFHQGKR